MPRIEIKSIQCGQYLIFKNVLNYVARYDRCINKHIGATHLLLPQKRKGLENTVGSQFSKAREFYDKEDKRLGMHVVVAFSPKEMLYLDHLKVLKIGYYLAETEFAGCMTYFAVHDHTELLHLDMLVMTVNVCTGKMYGCNRAGWSGIEFRLQKFLLNYMPENAIGEFQTAFEKYE